MFEALLIEKAKDGQIARLCQINDSELPDGDVLVRVAWSTLNYKDALAITGRGPIIKRYPMIPGIDFAGEVMDSTSPAFKPGDKVVLNGWGVGERHWGGLATRARVKAEWLVHLPSAFTSRQAMILGTAGYTAMLCVMALERAGLTPEKGPVLVTGASGGVGSVAIMLLARLGYHVAAVTGRMAEKGYLESIGAAEILERASFARPSAPLEAAHWAGAIDVAGGDILATVCATMQYGGVVAACGLAAGMAVPLTVAPFILRGVTLIGVQSVTCPIPERVRAWERLAELLDVSKLEALAQERPLDQAVQASEDLLEGRTHGRIIIPLDTSAG